MYEKHPAPRSDLGGRVRFFLASAFMLQRYKSEKRFFAPKKAFFSYINKV